MKFIMAIILLIMMRVMMFLIGINKSINSHSKYLGESIVLNCDTLKIIDFKLVRGVYILSNGVEVNEKIVYDYLDK